MSLWSEVAHHYQDHEEPDPPIFERNTEHTARKAHHCDACEAQILPGERYRKAVWLDDDGLHVHKTHVDTDHCERLSHEVVAWRDELMRGDAALEEHL